MSEDILSMVENYVVKLITHTFGFVPKIQVYFDSADCIKVFLDGSEDERKMMMGKFSNNFQAIKTMLRIFCKTNGYDSYLYIAPGRNATNISKNKERPNSDW